MQEKATVWTTSQREYLEWLALPKALREPKTEGAIAKQLEVNQATLWRWRQNPEFVIESQNIARQYLKSEVSEIYSALIEKAKTGDIPAIKLVMEMTGEYTPKQDITSNGETLKAPTVFLPAVDDTLTDVNR